ncbi:hypothetical protein [Lacisediminihabitans sp. H27-G8]
MISTVARKPDDLQTEFESIFSDRKHGAFRLGGVPAAEPQSNIWDFVL